MKEIKSPLTPLFQRGEFFYPPLKKGDKGGFERNKISPGPSFPKRGNHRSYLPTFIKVGRMGIYFFKGYEEQALPLHLYYAYPYSHFYLDNAIKNV
ncbi:MAG: hypothetical protein KA120_05955 [Candidatus Goldbacteria bacterium]|nr:hypothetical protein [Candidatus Goldiibacteriota bacterium]